MTEKNWEELLVWTFKGERFNERGIDLGDLEPLVHLRAVLVDLAKTIWRRQNPDRERLSPNADAELELRIFGFRAGSCEVAVYYAPPPLPPQVELFEEPPDARTLVDKLPVAARMVAVALRSLGETKKLPDDFPHEVLPDVQKLTKGLGPGEVVAIRVPPRRGVRVPVSPLPRLPAPPAPAVPASTSVEHDAAPIVLLDATLRAEIASVAQQSAKARRTVTGEVTMASVKGRAMIAVEGREVQVEFSPERELEVTTALRDHREVRLRVRGLADIELKTGRPRKIVAEDLRILKAPDPAAPSEALFERWAAEAPERLVEALRSGEVRPTLLTYAAEIAGKTLPSALVVPVLLDLLRHAAPIVREGATYGLAHHASDEVSAALRALVENDPSPGVRDAAKAVLEDL